MAEENVEETNVKVMVRVRLFNKREIKISEKRKEKLLPCVTMRGTTCAVLEYTVDSEGFQHEREREAFEFDHCFWSMPFDQYPGIDMPYATQVYVYERSGKVALEAAFNGFNVCIFAYGQTGSGKTYSMLGSDEDPGISPRLVDDLFARMGDPKLMTTKGKVECMFFEIYNEKVRDLFNKNSKAGEYASPRIRQHPTKGVYVEGLQRKHVVNADDAKELIKKGTLERAMAETKMNATSSRSHAIFQIQVTQNHPLKGTQTTATINLVDLAGSEKIKMSGVSGEALKEAMNINQSLSTLRRVIDVLIDNSTSKKQHVPPFRESVLTYVLSDSLGGNSKTQMIATISPHESNLEDTLGTLRYALRAKAIVCQARVNEEKSAEMVEAMKDEINRLKQMMREGGGAGGGGGGGGGEEISAETLAELEEKESELKRMEEEQQELQTQAEEMRRQLAEVDLAKQELTLAVSEQKRERFATAFRNAFLIQKDKKKMELNEKELQELRAEQEYARSRVSLLESDMEQRLNELDQLHAQNAFFERQLEETRAETSAKLTRLEAQNRDLSDMKTALELKLTSNQETMKREADDRLALEATVERLQADLVGLTHAVEREAIEKSKIREAFEKEVLENNDRIDALRRRKERYKQLVAEEETKTRALREAVKLHVNDREALLETVRAQQRIIAEKDLLMRSATRSCNDIRDKYRQLADSVTAKDEKVAILKEALNEYQHASMQWMKDLSMKEKEVGRLRAASDEVRLRAEASNFGSPPEVSAGIVRTDSSTVAAVAGGGGGGNVSASPFSNGGPMALIRNPSNSSIPAMRHTPPSAVTPSPRRAQSPSAAQVRSPFFHQPRVERHPQQASSPSYRAESAGRSTTRGGSPSASSISRQRWTSPLRGSPLGR